MTNENHPTPSQYRVRVTQTYQADLEVLAMSPEDAEQHIRQLINRGDLATTDLPWRPRYHKPNTSNLLTTNLRIDVKSTLDTDDLPGWVN